MPPAPLALLAPTAVRALLALVAIAIALAFDAFFLHAELVSVAIGVVLAFPDTFVLLANWAAAAISVALAFDALLVVTDLARRTVLIVLAFPRHHAVSQRRKPDQTKHATSGGLEHATTPGLLPQDTSHVIELTIVQDFLLFPTNW
jgi:hypothetical protein